MPNWFKASIVTCCVLACWAMRLAAAAACADRVLQNTASSPTPSAVALPLHVTTVQGIVADGVCVFVHRQTRPDGLVVLYFLTAASLFRDADGNRADLQLVSIAAVDQTISVSRDGVILPAFDEGIAVLTATVPSTNLVPEEVTFAAPPPGATFDIIGQQDLTNCLGAPVKSASRVFGVVSSCQPGHAATVMLLSMAEPFLIDQIPDLANTVGGPIRWVVNRRDVRGPSVLVPCGRPTTGEVEVPFQKQAAEVPLSATAAFLHSEPTRLGDVTVLKLDERTIKLRFTVGDTTSRAGPTCGPGHAVISIHIDLATERDPAR